MIAFDGLDGVFVPGQLELVDAVGFGHVPQRSVSKECVGHAEHSAIGQGERVGLGDDPEGGFIIVAHGCQTNNGGGG